MRLRLILGTLLVLAIVSCGGEGTPDTTSPEVAPTSTEAGEGSTTMPDEETTTSQGEGTPIDGEIEPPPLDPANFSQPTAVDHKYYPLVPGTQLVFDGVTLEDEEEIPHRIIFTVSDLTKVVAGVETIVTWILDFSEGELVEAEIAFFAQDDDGNVWQLGEYPEEYEDGVFVLAPAWLHGAEGAKAGLKMQANPQPDTDSYAQGWGPAVGWDDRGRIFEVGSQTCVPAGCYEDVLIIDEFSLEEPTFFQVKYYAPGIGNVQVGWKGNDPEGETLELIEVRMLDGDEMATVREEVLALEQSAYDKGNPAYAGTEPIRVPD